jgi:hypothetical protein
MRILTGSRPVRWPDTPGQVDEKRASRRSGSYTASAILAVKRISESGPARPAVGGPMEGKPVSRPVAQFPSARDPTGAGGRSFATDRELTPARRAKHAKAPSYAPRPLRLHPDSAASGRERVAAHVENASGRSLRDVPVVRRLRYRDIRTAAYSTTRRPGRLIPACHSII